MLIIKQGSNESRQRYLDHINEEFNKVGDYNNRDIIYAFTNGHLTDEFMISLVKQRSEP